MTQTTDPVFDQVPLAPGDPILDLKLAFNRDANPDKADLSVGIYQDEAGRASLFPAVVRAEALLAEERRSNPLGAEYLPLAGHGPFVEEAKKLLFGPESAVLREKRVAAIQTIGGTGALRIAGEFMKRQMPGSAIALSDPTWPLHRSIFERVGLEIRTYPYLSPATGALAFDEMMTALDRLPARTVVLTQTSCHNPSGIDLSRAQWEDVIRLAERRGLVLFLDAAYQGFGDGLVEDVWIARRLAETSLEFLAAQSFSKHFSLYNRRTGVIHAVTRSADAAERVQSQLKSDIRSMTSTCPVDGAEIVVRILRDPVLRTAWEGDLAHVRNRLAGIRGALCDRLAEHTRGAWKHDFRGQKGMFSFTGLGKEQVIAMRQRFGVYLVENGRICIGAINRKNVDHVARSIAAVYDAEGARAGESR